MTYFFVRFFEFFLSRLPYPVLHAMGRILGSIVYALYPAFRKKSLSNLYIAFGKIKSEKELKTLARRSFQNVMITLLEFPRLGRGDLAKIVELIEPEKMTDLQKKGKGMVFLTGHQSNWEIPFVAANMLSPGGIGVGQPARNHKLYKWIVSIRQSQGGTIVTPRQALKAGLKALKEGNYIGIVGDQAHPGSPYSYPFFGTRMWVSNGPALLAYKTHSPIIVVTTKRKKNRYEMRGSDPLWPNYDLPMKESVKELMDRSLHYLEESLKGSPDQWMWIHDRWKQQGIDHVKRIYRYGFILVIVPKEENLYLRTSLKKIYPRSFLTFKTVDDDLFVRDLHYQLVLDFVGLPKVRRYYKRLGAVRAVPLTVETMKEILVKPECQHTVSI
ncbi:MAG: Lipid A biosynthesis lauroyltransferase [Chlamydiales bacterium]|nr:Lipid A biosynthesis lauroyltransferase [Chlamydiales bacterium]MCH9619139.1 Lipid A biosynthesis lauroyltransferase [Chlamydiales bacterium]MCH9622401.1 Lipid A biosynthesis lauroyltransferase [Chlamydiales bacterium]